MTNSGARTEGRATVLNNDEPSQPEGQQGDKTYLCKLPMINSFKHLKLRPNKTAGETCGSRNENSEWGVLIYTFS